MNSIEEIENCFILKETLKALDYLHQQGHIHRDIKAGNNNNGVVKLSDLGVSTCTFDYGDRQCCRNTFTGTPCWKAPEVMQAETGYDLRADIWSFGITALELVHDPPPLSQYPPSKVLLSKSFEDMVAMCLVKDPKKRPTAGKLLKHSFYRNAKPPQLSLKKLLADLQPLLNPMKALQNNESVQQLPSKKMASTTEEAGSMSDESIYTEAR